MGHSPDQSPQDGQSQEESHDASDPHPWDNGGVGIEGEIQRLIHARVESLPDCAQEGREKIHLGTETQSGAHGVLPRPSSVGDATNPFWRPQHVTSFLHNIITG